MPFPANPKAYSLSDHFPASYIYPKVCLSGVANVDTTSAHVPPSPVHCNPPYRARHLHRALVVSIWLIDPLPNAIVSLERPISGASSLVVAVSIDCPRDNESDPLFLCPILVAHAVAPVHSLVVPPPYALVPHAMRPPYVLSRPVHPPSRSRSIPHGPEPT